MFQMEKFMYISILLFINAVFIFPPSKGGSYHACNSQTETICSHICDRSATGCCEGGEEDSSWRTQKRQCQTCARANLISDFMPSNIQYNACSNGQCTVNGV